MSRTFRRLPTTLGWRDKALNGAWKKYRAALDQAAEIFSAEVMQDLTRNAAGSPTYRYYEDTDPRQRDFSRLLSGQADAF